MKPLVFIASSTEGLPIANAVHASMGRDVYCTTWNQSALRPGQTIIEALLQSTHDYEFGIFVLTPDDSAIIRGINLKIARDNVWFEMGLFMSRVGKERTFMIVPILSKHDQRGLRILSDLYGIIWVDYDSTHPNMEASVGTACNRILKAIREATPSEDRMIKVHLFNKQSGKCLEVADHRPGIGERVQQYECKCGDNQTWLIRRCEGKKDWVTSIIAVESHKCLEVPNNSTTDGEALLTGEYVGQPNQQWKLIKKTDGTFTIQGVESGLHLTPGGNNVRANRAPAIQKRWPMRDLRQHWCLQLA